MSTPSIVTGEAVVLELRPATVIHRTAAVLIDAVVLGLVALGLSMLAGLVMGDMSQMNEAAASATGLMLTVTVLVGVPLLWETVSRGRSPGKLALGLRVVRDDGGAIRSRHALARVLTAVFEVWMTAGSIAIIVAMVNQKGKRLGDMAAGTYVITSRLPKLPTPLPGVPEPLQPWAASADIGRVPDGLAVAITRFLRQAPKMLPDARARNGWELTQAVIPYVAPGPGSQVPPETFLLAVVAERRNRDYAILQARRESLQHRASRLMTR